MWCHKLLFQLLPHLYLVFLKACFWRSVPALNVQGHSLLCRGWIWPFASNTAIQHLIFKTYFCFLPPPHFRTNPPVLQNSSHVLCPSAWAGQQAAHWGHGLGRNFLFPSALQLEVIAKPMGQLSSKFSNKASQLVRIIRLQLALVWSQGLPRMSLPGPVQKLQSP